MLPNYEKAFMEQPSKAVQTYPYTGIYQFVPLVKSTEWPIQKIYDLAQLHVGIIDNLKSIYTKNLQEIRNEIDAAGNSLLQGFYGMLSTISEPNSDLSQ
jgi:hypothetical protein